MQAQTAHFSGVQNPLGSGLSSPGGVAVDGSGNVYIADTSNNRILKETLDSGAYTQSTVVSSGLLNPQGVAVDGSGNLYIADTGNSRVLIETLSAGSYTQSVVGSGLLNPQGVAVDGSGNVYIADTGNDQVLIETLSGGIYTQNIVVNSGLSGPGGVAVDGSGNVYIANTGLGQVLLETLSLGTYSPTTVAGGLSGVQGVAVDASGNVYAADGGGGPPSKLFVETPLLGGGYTQSTLGTGLLLPGGVAVDASGNIYVADTGNSRVLKIQLTANFGSVNVGSTSSVISMPFTFDTGGVIYSVAALTQGIMGLDFENAGTGTCITLSHTYNPGDNCTVDVTFTPHFPGLRYGAAQLWSASTGYVVAYGLGVGIGLGPQATFLPGTQSGVDRGFEAPFGIALDSQGDVFVADQGAGILYEEALSGGIYSRQTVDSALSSITGVAIDGAGNLYVASLNGSVVKETPQAFRGGFTQTTIVSGLGNLDGNAVDAAGNLYITAYSDNLAYKFTVQADGSYVTTTFGSAFSGPTGIAVDAGGNVYVSNDYNNGGSAGTAGDIYKETLQADGSYVQTTVVTGFGEPESVVVDPNGNLYIGDTQAQTVYKEELQPDGSYIQSTIASSLPNLWWIAVDQAGNLYLSQRTSPSGIESKITVAAPPTLSFASTNVGSISSDSPQTVTLSNIGNAPLVFPVPLSGSNPSVTRNFALNGAVATPCPLVEAGASSPGSLAANSACLLPVSFAPLDSGGDFGSVVLTDTNLNAAGPDYATQTVSLFGTGVALPASQLVLTGVPASVVAGANLGTVTVLVENSQGIVVTTSTASVTVTITGPGDYSQMVIGSAVNGVVSLNLSSLVLATAGVYTVTATSSGLSPSVAMVTVTANTHLELDGVAPTVASGGNLGIITVSVENGNGTVATSSTASITVTITGPNEYSQTATAAAVNGVATFNLSSFALAATGTYTVSATSPNIPSDTSTVTVTAATTTATVTTLLAVPNPAIAGQPVTLTATVAPAPTGSPAGTVSFYHGSTLLGSIAVNSSGIAAFTTSSLPTGALIMTAAYSGNAGFGGSTSSALTETVVAAAPVTTTTTLTVSPDPAFDGQPATLTATVSPAPTGSPAGTVSFYSGTTLLGMGTLDASGVATFTSGSLVVGADSLTAVYAGDAGFAASTSAALTLTVTTSFSVTAPTTAVPVAPGGAVTVDLTVPPLGGAFNSVVTLSASGLPAGATATFNPPTVTPGSAGAPSVMTIQLATLAAGIPANLPADHPKLPAAPFAIVIGLFGTGLSAVFGRKRSSRQFALVLLLTSLGVTASVLTGCGGGFQNSQTPAGNYTITVTGTSGSFHASTTVTLAVQ
jgi:sugar lactone lactonase YvrE